MASAAVGASPRALEIGGRLIALAFRAPVARYLDHTQFPGGRVIAARPESPSRRDAEPS